MKSILNKIYYGELRPCEAPVSPTDRYIKNQKTIYSLETEIKKSFPGCDEYLDKYKDALRAESQYESESDFVRGFRLGILLMIDVISSD